MTSNNVDKYEYLTDGDLSLKPSTVEQARFDYSQLSKFLNKGLKKKKRKKKDWNRYSKILKTKIKNSYKQLKIKKINVESN